MNDEKSSELSESQREYWERRLEDSERAVEVAKHMLGIIAVKETIDEQGTN